MNHIKLFFDDLDAMELLGDAEKGRLFTALLIYGMSGKATQLSGNERFLFPMMRARIDAEKAAESELSEVRRKSGKKGAQAKLANLANAKFAKQSKQMPDLLSLAEFAKSSPLPSSPPSPSPPSSPPIPPVISPVSLSPVLTSPPKERPPKGGRKKAPAVGVEELGFGKDLASAFSDWLQYKRERREEYQPKGLEMLVTRLRRNVEIYGEESVAELIRNCMASNWQGIIWDRLEKQQTRKTQGGGNIFMDMLREEENHG